MQKTSGKILGAVTQFEAERLLSDWANLANSQSAIDRFVRRNGSLIGTILELNEPSATAFSLITLRNHLRDAWDSADKRKRDWSIFQLRRKFAEWSRTFAISNAEELIGKPMDWFEQCPEATALEATMFYFQTKLTGKAKHCGGETCPAPYFIAKRKGQKHCGTKCSAEATRESKRIWAAKHRGGAE